MALKWAKSLGWYLKNRVRQLELKDRSFAFSEPLELVDVFGEYVDLREDVFDPFSGTVPAQVLFAVLEVDDRSEVHQLEQLSKGYGERLFGGAPLRDVVEKQKEGAGAVTGEAR